MGRDAVRFVRDVRTQAFQDSLYDDDEWLLE